jgi:hypothetical protein
VRRVLLVIIVCTIPALMFLNAWQVFRFGQDLDEVRVLEDRQRELIEENKNTLVGIEVLSSPSRLEEIVNGMEDIEKRLSVPRVLIRIGSSDVRSDANGETQ